MHNLRHIHRRRTITTHQFLQKITVKVICLAKCLLDKCLDMVIVIKDYLLIKVYSFLSFFLME